MNSNCSNSCLIWIVWNNNQVTLDEILKFIGEGRGETPRQLINLDDSYNIFCHCDKAYHAYFESIVILENFLQKVFFDSP